MIWGATMFSPLVMLLALAHATTGRSAPELAMSFDGVLR